jgi:hypothetical protein
VSCTSHDSCAPTAEPFDDNLLFGHDQFGLDGNKRIEISGMSAAGEFAQAQASAFEIIERTDYASADYARV